MKYVSLAVMKLGTRDASAMMGRTRRNVWRNDLRRRQNENRRGNVDSWMVRSLTKGGQYTAGRVKVFTANIIGDVGRALSFLGNGDRSRS